MNIIEKIKYNRLSFEISSKLLMLTRNKRKICAFALKQKNNQENDLFYYLCTQYGYILINDKIIDFYDDSQKTLEDLYKEYDMVIILDGKRYCKETTVKLSILDINTLKLTFYTNSTFNNETCEFLSLSLLDEIYEKIPKEERVKNNIHFRVKQKYKYLIK